MFSNMLLTGSITASAPDHDANSWQLYIDDHYLLLVYEDTYEAPLPEVEVQVPLNCYYLRVQHPDDNNEITLDWSRWLGEGDALSTITWTATAGVTVSQSLHNALKSSATFSIAGAVTGETYLLRCTAVTQLGRTEVRSVQIDIRESVAGTRQGVGWWRIGT